MVFTKIEKRGKKEYAYEITSYWDKKKQMPKQKKKYLGRVINKDKKQYEKLLEHREPEKLILDFGDTFLLDKYFQKVGMNKLLEEIFQDNSSFAKSAILYRLCYPSAMKYSSRWLEGNYARLMFPKVNLSSQRISEFFSYLGEEEVQKTFFEKYIPTFSGSKKGIVIDATSLANQIHIPFTNWGRCGEEIDKQIRFLLVVDKNNEEPLFFRHYPGNIVDVSTLQTTLMELKKFGISETYVYVDAGYFSEDNIKEMYSQKMNFLTRLPSIRTLYKELIESETLTLETFENRVKYGKRVLFIKQKEVALFGEKAYAHVIIDPERKGRETTNLLLKTFDEKEKLNQKEMEYQLKTRGIMILVSSFQIDKNEVVPAYYIRMTAEKMFGFSKDDLEFLPLRVHSEQTLRGFLFFQFITLIAFVKLKKALGKNYTVEDVTLTMRNLKAKVYDNEILIAEMTKEQRLIADKLDILVPKKAGI
jgi:transposase